MTVQAFCPVCGASLASGVQFCGSCGTRVSGTEAAHGISGWVGYAGVWQRFLATLIDGVIVLIVAGAPGLLVGLAADSAVLGYGIYVAVYVIYFAWGNGSGGTWGKQIIGIKVISLKSGGDIGFVAGLLRFIVWWIGSLPFYLGWLWMLWDGQKQGWHDKVAGSIVVKARP
jgi:uncharacterized RDD family membrane protein YckC